MQWKLFYMFVSSTVFPKIEKVVVDFLLSHDLYCNGTARVGSIDL